MSVIAPERAALGRARWSITARLTLLTTVIVLLIECLIYLITANMRENDTRRDLLWTVAHSSISSPPACTWLVVERDGVAAGTPGLPAGFPLTESLRTADGPKFEEVHRDGQVYSVLTQRRGDEVVQVVYDERFHLMERENLLFAFALALLLTALTVAVVVAMASRFLCEKAIAPLNDALTRQRRFVADASHELRAPLTQLHTRAQLLARKADAMECPEVLSAEMRRLVNGTRQLGDVVDDLLRSAISGEQPRTEVVDLAGLADEVVRAEDARAVETGLVLEVLREPGQFLVPGAESALRRVVTALVDNAIGHTPAGGTVVVELEAPAPGTVRLSVRDSGVGFDQADGRSLFERFSRGSNGRGQRFGIGLSLVREVVEAHRGTVSAEGVPGAGAVFTVDLPAVEPAIPLPRAESASVARAALYWARGAGVHIARR
ncbi:sensor histidine kinase [Umezawaea endophytica]|uniref:Sensor-like histidine kinase SenX3 n=1 Tax=Umezawaea endophytica TaxID=1654476 RepID=A0A9X2VPQ0_9PSEU|nr:HAMP domain-containing sensor histidine kinase [Umezawaea endophytica]MCS7480024.1 HAMP domain-containing histidine kinase [Umezawaea endophytica]